MNQLSWLLYLGNVAGNLGFVLFIFGLICTGLAVAFTCLEMSVIDMMEDAIKYRSNQLTDVAVTQQLKLLGKPRFVKTVCFTLLAFIFWTTAAFMPSQETVYAIAASQMGEQVLKTPLAHKANEALTSWLDKQIEANKAKPDPAVQKSD